MPHSGHTADGQTNLRQRALAKLSVGPSKEHKRASTADALAALHRLASAPSTAVDAMALLHEMQVHQVELDLQQEELGRSRSELEAALIRQTALFERAPVGYMTIDAGTVVVEINLAGVRLLGAAQDDLLGRPLAGLLSAHSADLLQTLLVRARDGLEPETRELQLQPLAGTLRPVQAAVDRDTMPDRFLLVLMAAASPSPGGGL
jgi:PAS domain S-box-containing protein